MDKHKKRETNTKHSNGERWQKQEQKNNNKITQGNNSKETKIIKGSYIKTKKQTQNKKNTNKQEAQTRQK